MDWLLAANVSESFLRRLSLPSGHLSLHDTYYLFPLFEMKHGAAEVCGQEIWRTSSSTVNHSRVNGAAPPQTPMHISISVLISNTAHSLRCSPPAIKQQTSNREAQSTNICTFNQKLDATTPWGRLSGRLFKVLVGKQEISNRREEETRAEWITTLPPLEYTDDHHKLITCCSRLKLKTFSTSLVFMVKSSQIICSNDNLLLNICSDSLMYWGLAARNAEDLVSVCFFPTFAKLFKKFIICSTTNMV